MRERRGEPPRPRSRSRTPRRSATRALVPLAIVGIVLLFVAAGAVYVAAHKARWRYVVAERVTRDPAVMRHEIDRAIDRGLTALGIPADERVATAHGPDVASALTIALPPAIPLAEANLALTRRTDAIGATTWDALEQNVPGGTMLSITIGSADGPVARVQFVSSQQSAAVAEARARLALVLVDVTPETLPVVERLLRAAPRVDAAIVAGDDGAALVARELSHRGVELIAHLPMEPKGYPSTKPGPDPILVDMTRDDVRDHIERALHTVGGARGLSNRMGSLATQDRVTMRSVLGAAADHRLFFLEIPTTPDTVCRKVGREVGASVLTADAVLDARHGRPEAIARQVAGVASRAVRAGGAIAIVHADSLTCALVARALPDAAANGVHLAPVSAIE